MKLYSVILYQNGFSSDLITEKIIRDNIILTKQKEVIIFLKRIIYNRFDLFNDENFITIQSLKKTYLLLHGGGDESVVRLAVCGELLHLDEESDTVADELEELDLGVADTVSVGDVVGAVVGGGVDTTGTTLLETEKVEDLVQLLLVLSHGP